MPSIKIQRTRERNNIIRNYKIFIDGQLVGKIGNGETKEFKASIGQHIITAKIDWCSSPDVILELEDNTTKTLIVGSAKNLKRSFVYYLTSGSKNYLTLNEI